MQRLNALFGVILTAGVLFAMGCGDGKKRPPPPDENGGQGGAGAGSGGDESGGDAGTSSAAGGAGGDGSAGTPSGGVGAEGGTDPGPAGTGGETVEPGTGGTATGGTGGAGGEGGAEPGPTVPPGCDTALDFTTATHFYDAVRCLFTGPQASQKDVLEGALEPERIAVVRGRITNEDGSPLAGVRVTQLRDSRVGWTSTRADGRYDMAVQGGGQLTLRFVKDGYLAVQRQESVGWQAFGVLPDIVMLERAAEATHVDLGGLAEPELLRGTRSTDDSGSRQQALLVAPGTTATLERTDGTMEELSALDVRMVEYTVGEQGPARMPGDLPSSSAYTYAVDLSIDQAEGEDVRTVRFDPPLIGYVENFLSFPAGTTVPLGFYEGQRDVWQAADSGVVIDVLAVDDGLASIDSDGDGEADGADVLASLGIDEAERVKLAEEYEEGASLWRIQLPHFSIWDCNWPFGPPADALAPDVSVEAGDTDDCRTPRGGSIIGCEDQTLGEVLPISGTPYALHYQSERMPGRKDGRGLDIRPEAGSAPPASAKRIDLEFEILGVQSTASLPIDTGARYEFAWDGLDAWGRAWQGRQNAVVRVGYVYDGAYQNALRFGQVGTGVPITGDRSRQEITLWTEWRGKLGGLDQRATGFGGWSLDVQHLYDPRGGTLWLGSGERRTSERIGNAIDTVAGTGTAGFAGDDGPATSALVSSPHGIVVAPDGSVFLADEGTNRVRKILPNGVITTYAGTGASSDTGDGGLATAATISRPLGLALTPEGFLYVGGRSGLVRVIDPTTGIIRTAAGGGSPADGRGDGGLAINARFRETHSLAFTSDGSLLVVDTLENTVRRVAPDGAISTICGQPNTASSTGDGGPALTATLNTPLGIAVSRDGSIFISEADGDRVRKIDASGVISTFAGTGVAGNTGDGGPAAAARLSAPHSVAVGPDGSVYITDEGNDRVRRVRPDGIIETTAGGGTALGDGGAPLQARFRLPRVVYHHSDGTLWIADYEDQRIRRIKPGLPGFSTEDILLASADASEVYVFDDHGKHLRTVDSLLGVTTQSFDYDASGLLVSVTDRDANVTSIERNADGAPVGIIGPYGERTTLTLAGNGYLGTLTNAAGETVELEHTDEGLLTRLETPRTATESDVHRFSYDSLGRLLSDEGPTGVVQALERTTTEGGHEVVVTENDARPVSYAIDRLSVDGQTTRTLTDADGLASTSVQKGATTTMRTPTGALTTTVAGDPRFGMQSSFPATQRFDFSGSHTVTTAIARNVILADATNPLSASALTDTITVNSRATTRSWNKATRTWTVRSPLGRELELTLDERGHLLSTQIGNLTPQVFAYDSRGRVISSTMGSRVHRFEYDAAGDIAAIIDPLDQATSLTRDAVGRILRIVHPDASTAAFQSDASWAVTAVTPPARAEHTFSYGPGGLLQEYAPPPLTSGTGTAIDTPIGYSYDVFAALAGISWPNEETASFEYEPATGSLERIQLPGQAVVLDYEPATSRPSKLTRGADSLSFTYTGALPTRFDWSGQVTGSVSFVFDTSLRLTSDRLNTNAVSFTYDNDGLLTNAGSQRYTRDAATGFATATTLGTVTDTFTHDALGELTRHVVESTATTPSTLYDRSDVRDALGRVVEREETLLGETRVLTYEYDVRGRLVEVTRDTEVVASYSYDDNGNRLSATIEGTSRQATYDAQDRLVVYGSANYAFDERGRLVEKRDGADVTSYAYDTLGPLRSVTLPDGRVIEYVLDPSGRRVAKKLQGVIQRQWLYRDGLAPLGELGPTGAIVSRFVYGDGLNVPDYMVRGGVNYRLVTDRLGSVRLVVNAATGEVAQRIDYDEFGAVLLDTNPGFQPFGFAGGLYDPDTALVRFGARDYDSFVGRWTSKDPLFFDGQDSNLFAYAFNDPVNYVDPEGEAANLVVGVGAAGADLLWQLSQNGWNLGCVDWVEVGVTGVGAATGFGLLSRLRVATGPLKQWVRIGGSYSKALQSAIPKSIRWGASPAKGGKYIKEIGSPTLQRFNQWLRGQRLPGSSWRVQDPGHFHLGPKPPGVP